ncbi:hypothetical protein SAMN06265360_10640 [Haloechinothrix alba]|uniref:Uncharacterized protein n=1 Tax=Haloechinothrix alba TaxID=664784 RepID=A0A238WCL1_9PSEU|nr:hypothetical protein [Haloechinothrix alba]SNR44316.1 hypothetical protein SAMN06265360_10640 [Haloechinothrix alba]
MTEAVEQQQRMYWQARWCQQRERTRSRWELCKLAVRLMRGWRSLARERGVSIEYQRTRIQYLDDERARLNDQLGQARAYLDEVVRERAAVRLQLDRAEQRAQEAEAELRGGW